MSEETDLNHLGKTLEEILKRLDSIADSLDIISCYFDEKGRMEFP